MDPLLFHSIILTAGNPEEEEKCDDPSRLNWKEDAIKYVDFETKDENGQVVGTLWIEPIAFNCVKTKKELENVTLSVSEVREKYQTETEDIKAFRNDSRLDPNQTKNQEQQKDSVQRQDTEPPKDSEQIKDSEQPKDLEPQQESEELKDLKRRIRTTRRVKTVLHRWRQYEIEVTAQNNETGLEAKYVFEFNTFYWDCDDGSGKQITATQLCDGKKHCPSGKDEDPKTCKVTQLPKRLSYTLYVYMALVILLYFIYMRSTQPSLLGQHLQMIAMKAFSKNHSQGNKSDFLALYRDAHLSPGFERFSGDLKYEISQNPGDVEVCKWIKEAEQELHSDAKAVYDCILTNFGGSHQVTVRIIEPDGSIMAKIKTKIDQVLWPRKIKWYFFTIIFMFAVLCLHIFDYVKDIGNPIHLRKLKLFM